MAAALRAALVAGAAATACASATGPTAFAAISDWGGTNVPPYTTAAQVAVAGALETVVAKNNVEFVLSAGNNFMPNGLPEGRASSLETETRFANTWGNVYNGTALEAIPWYITGGWMDWLGNATAERAFTTSSSSRWQYPSLWQSINVLVPPDYATLQILMLDTVTLAGDLYKNPGQHDIPAGTSSEATSKYYLGTSTEDKDLGVPTGAPVPAPAVTAAAAPGPAPAGRRRLRDFNTADHPPPISQLQWQWLGTMLNESTADWIVVVGNDPIWSAGEHGPTWALADQLLPMLQAAGVSLYISGRDPVPQHFKPTSKYPAVDMVVIGNGAGGNYTQARTLPNAARCPQGTLAWSGSTNAGGFITVAFESLKEAGAVQMSVTFYDETEAVLYRFSKPNPRTGGRNDPPASFREHVFGASSEGALPPSEKRTAYSEMALGLLGFLMALGGVYFYLRLQAQYEAEKAGRGRRMAASGAPIVPPRANFAAFAVQPVRVRSYGTSGEAGAGVPMNQL